MSADRDAKPSDYACALMRVACDELFFGVDGRSVFTSVMVVGCYSGADEGEVRRMSAACLQTRTDMPESTARLLARLREVVADLEARLAMDQIQHTAPGGDA